MNSIALLMSSVYRVSSCMKVLGSFRSSLTETSFIRPYSFLYSSSYCLYSSSSPLYPLSPLYSSSPRLYISSQPSYLEKLTKKKSKSKSSPVSSTLVSKGSGSLNPNNKYQNNQKNSTSIQPIGAQTTYMSYLKDKRIPVVICTGLAGTGKTMFACYEAVYQLKHGHVDRIIITRPTVMADDELGFLPGEIESKMQPWTRPLFDYMYDAASREEVQMWLRFGMLEILPLGYMRGRTFKNTFIIGDECQNIKVSSMKMLLTRLGEGSKVVVVGDLEQSDLRGNQKNGLGEVIVKIRERYGDFEEADKEILEEGFGLVHLDASCIRRHPMVTKILEIWKE